MIHLRKISVIDYNILSNKALNSTFHCVCMGFIALVTAMVLGVKSRYLLLSISVLGVTEVFLNGGFQAGKKLCLRTLKTAVLWGGIQKALRTWLGSNPSHSCTSSQLYSVS